MKLYLIVCNKNELIFNCELIENEINFKIKFNDELIKN
jgi:hypothetical protein